MVKRDILVIDEEKCTGCGVCVPACNEGALKVIDGKLRLISDLFCDGLGACVGHCPTGALTIVKKEAKAYDEVKTLKENIIPAGSNTLKAHLEHLRDHGQDQFLKQANDYLKKNKINNPLDEKTGRMEKKKKEGDDMGHGHGHAGCPGSKMMQFDDQGKGDEAGKRQSQLKQWPIQMHLISPQAPYYRNADVVIAADCVAFSLGDFHKDYLKGKALAIACPKLDSDMEIYVEKMKSMIDDSKINTLTVMIMQVPCCGGLLGMAKEAAGKTKRKIPIKAIVVGLQGNILSEDWV